MVQGDEAINGAAAITCLLRPGSVAHAHASASREREKNGKREEQLPGSTRHKSTGWEGRSSPDWGQAGPSVRSFLFFLISNFLFF